MSIPFVAKEHLLKEQEVLRRFYSDRHCDMRMLTEPPPDVREDIGRGMLVMWTWPADLYESVEAGMPIVRSSAASEANSPIRSR